jgi:hypothetical protein
MCDRLIDFVIRHVQGGPNDVEATKFHDHLQDCPACRGRHRQLRIVIRPQPEALCPTCESLLADDEPEAGDCGLPHAGLTANRPRAAGVPRLDLARCFGVSMGTAQDIVHMQT